MMVSDSFAASEKGIDSDTSPSAVKVRRCVAVSSSIGEKIDRRVISEARLAGGVAYLFALPRLSPKRLKQPCKDPQTEEKRSMGDRSLPDKRRAIGRCEG